MSDLNITIITNRAGYNRSSYYNHILKPDLSFTILTKYGKALGHDFSRELPEIQPYMRLDEPTPGYQTNLTTEELIKQRDLWKDKYLELLEKYNRLIEDQLQG